MPVYFVQAGQDGAIKIGYARNVANRLVKMRVDCPIPLTLLAVLEGDADYERRLHERFESHWRQGEWFEPAAELLAFIGTLPEPEPAKRKSKLGAHPLSAWLEITGASPPPLRETSESRLRRFIGSSPASANRAST